MSGKDKYRSGLCSVASVVACLIITMPVQAVWAGDVASGKTTLPTCSPEDFKFVPRQCKLDEMKFSDLKESSQKRIKALAPKLWSDYNIHDSGITIFELLCYVITDLGYRGGYPEDVLNEVVKESCDLNEKFQRVWYKGKENLSTGAVDVLAQAPANRDGSVRIPVGTGKSKDFSVPNIGGHLIPPPG